MAYDKELADRLRELLGAEPDLTEKAMFGGLAFLVAGHMAVAASGQSGLMLRADPESSETLLLDPRVSRFQMRGRAMAGWLLVQVDPTTSDADLGRWVESGVAYVRTLPPK
ncbi:MAG: hypothetical protein JWP61_548 [Friedmanniella sp.]|nr:hypothetical protein [Friedmanniella sp.]